MAQTEMTSEALAALIIATYGLEEVPAEHLQGMWDDDALLAVHRGGRIVFDETRHESHEMRTYKTENTYFDGSVLVERKYPITESMANGGFSTTPEITVHAGNVKFYR